MCMLLSATSTHFKWELMLYCLHCPTLNKVFLLLLLLLLDPYTWPWSPNGHGHGHEWPTATPFVQCQSALPFWDTAISKFDHENPWSRSCVWSKVKVIFDLQNSKVTVMGKVKPICHIWGLEFNPYVCFSFSGNQTNFGWDIGNFIFDLENSRSRSWPRAKPMVTFQH